LLGRVDERGQFGFGGDSLGEFEEIASAQKIAKGRSMGGIEAWVSRRQFQKFA
jgi:hypothetical protein